MLRALPLVFCIFSLSSWSLSLDWSGGGRWEGYYQNSPDSSWYGSYHFVLQPKVHVIDGLTLMGRLDMDSIGESRFSPSDYDRQTGFVFIYGDDSPIRLNFEPLYLRLSQFYGDYQDEFFKLRIGRAPYHFGLGVSYSADKDPFKHWMSTHYQTALRLEYGRFYLQPMLFYKNQSAVALAQAGWLKEDWEVEAFFQYDFSENSFVEVFGQYNSGSWEARSSVSYDFGKDKNMALAIEAIAQIPANWPIHLEIKGGGALGRLAFHPNYDLALLLWNRRMRAPDEKEAQSMSPYQVAEGQVQRGAYFSPRLIFSFFEDHLKIKPLFLLVRDWDTKKFNYEWDLEGLYHWNERLFFSLKGGALYENQLSFAGLAQAAVSF